jgi:hypothetical protein
VDGAWEVTLSGVGTTGMNALEAWRISQSKTGYLTFLNGDKSIGVLRNMRLTTRTTLTRLEPRLEPSIEKLTYQISISSDDTYNTSITRN